MEVRISIWPAGHVAQVSKPALLESLVLGAAVSFWFSMATLPAAEPPVRYVGEPPPDLARPDGGLRPVVGAQNFQVFRATRARPDLSDGRGWTFNHATTLTWWQGRFYLEFINSPIDEHGWPTHAVLSSSVDGRRWTKPRIVFPAWESKTETKNGLPLRSLIHQRMGFFNAPNGRLLVLSHYGIWDKPFGGPGHVVREVGPSGSFGPIYFLRYGEGWNEARAFSPFYTASPDKGFVAACDALLADPFITDQWFETQLGYPPAAYMKIAGEYDPKDQRKALSFYRRKDGQMVALWKKAWSALSTDEGRTWSTPVQAPGFARTFAKLWGQRTEDGRFAIAYCPQDSPPGNRWPLAVVTSDDGCTFDNMLVIHGEVPLRRYPGLAKDIGPQYVRGLEGGEPPGSDLWLTYSVNKEDIWVSRVPVPIRASQTAHVHETFDDLEVGGVVTGWNIYSPLWSSVEVVAFPSRKNHSLRLKDGDPYDYARAVRVFPESSKVSVSFKLLAERTERGRLDVDLLDARGHCPVRVSWTETGAVQANTGQGPQVVRKLAEHQAGRWATAHIELDCGRQTFSLSLNGAQVLADAPLIEPAATVERLSFRTGEARPIFKEQAHIAGGPPNESLYFTGAIAPQTDRPISPAVFYLDEVQTVGQP